MFGALFHLLFGILFTFHLQYTNRDNNPLASDQILSNNHLSRNSDTTISQNSALAICCWSLRTEQTTLPFYKVTDIDQTDLHRFEPSSRTLNWDEHSHQESRLQILDKDKPTSRCQTLHLM